MPQATLTIEEIAAAIRAMPLENYAELRHVLDEEENKKREKQENYQARMERYKKTEEWLHKNRADYMNQWVCLYGDKLIAHGTDALEVHAKAKAVGIESPLLEHIVEELPWGGW